MIKAIIFDCFGVLAEDGWLPFKRKYIGDNEALAKEVADLGKQNEYGMLSNQDLERTIAQVLQVNPQEYRRAVSRRVPNEELFAFIATKLKPHYKIGLMSNANFNVVHELFAPEQAALFDAVVLSYEAHLVKPDPRMYRLMAERLGATPEECVFVDDIPRYCMAAEEAGMTAFCYENVQQAIVDIQQLLTQSN